MRIIVIGGTGHIGTFLVPRLVKAGHEVIVASRAMRKPYVSQPAWATVERIGPRYNEKQMSMVDR